MMAKSVPSTTGWMVIHSRGVLLRAVAGSNAMAHFLHRGKLSRARVLVHLRCHKTGNFLPI